VATLTATRSVSRASTDTTLVRDVADKMMQKEPDAAPLYVLTNNAKRKEPSKTPKFEWFEDQEVGLWDRVNQGATDLASNVTNFLVSDGTIFAAGDLVAVAKANSSNASEEIVLVTTVAGNTLTVTRAIGGSGGDTLGATASLRIIGSAFLEDDGVGAQRYTAKSNKVSYCQIFKWAVKITNTMEATEQFASPDGERAYQLAKGMVRHRSEIEAAGLWGRGSESLSEPSSRWTTQGFKPSLSSNITDASTTLTLIKLNDFSESAFRYGNPEKKKLVIAAPKFISAMNYFSQNKLLTKVGDKVFGVQIKEVIVGHGTYMLANNFRMYDNSGATGIGDFRDEAYSIDLTGVKMRYLAGNGKSMDTKLYSDVVKDGKTVRVDEYRSQIGWQIMQESWHARMFGVSAYS
jgi:hypothetical protein